MTTLSTERQSFELDLLRGFADVLAAEAPAELNIAHRPPTEEEPHPKYASDEIGIYIDRWPDIREGSITITDYVVQDSPSLSDSVVGVQVTIRHHDLATVKAVGRAIFDSYHGRPHGMLGPVTLVMALRMSGTNAGQDSNERQGRLDNYYLTVHRPSAHRI